LAVITSAIGCLERLVSRKTYAVRF